MANDLECLRCGHCCPDTCPEKESDGQKATCLIHPKITGKPRTVMPCDLPPERYFQGGEGAACEAALQNLKHQYPNLTYETVKELDGRVGIKPGSLRLNR